MRLVTASNNIGVNVLGRTTEVKRKAVAAEPTLGGEEEDDFR